MSGWEDDDDWGSSDEEETDLGDDTVSVLPALPPMTIRPREADASYTRNKSTTTKEGSGRRVKIKPMPAAMRNKWPELVSCLMTMSSGKQVLLVK